MKKLGIISIIGVLAMALLATGAYAGANSELIQAYINHDIKLTVNGAKFTPKDSDGNTMEPIIYNGSTYLPVRALTNAIGGSATWDDKTQTVAIQVGPAADVPYKDAGSSPATVPPKEKLLFTEDFEFGYKNDYRLAPVSLGSGQWELQDAALLDYHIYTDELGPKNGHQAIKIMPGGFISTSFDIDGTKTVKFKHANIGLNNVSCKLQQSTDGGTTWTDVNSDIITTSKLTEQTIKVDYSGKIRFKISAPEGSYKVIIIDDFSIYN